MIIDIYSVKWFLIMHNHKRLYTCTHLFFISHKIKKKLKHHLWQLLSGYRLESIGGGGREEGVRHPDLL